MFGQRALIFISRFISLNIWLSNSHNIQMRALIDNLVVLTLLFQPIEQHSFPWNHIQGYSHTCNIHVYQRLAFISRTVSVVRRWQSAHELVCYCLNTRIPQDSVQVGGRPPTSVSPAPPSPLPEDHTNSLVILPHAWKPIPSRLVCQCPAECLPTECPTFPNIHI